ncbi:tetratricopeptide repeat protein [Sphingomonas sp.]|uniref:SPOR domain-containing protein n=1 Tax=Sphingomonas sp. TaxID=28214 RepID=UPI003B00D8BD
MSRTRLGRAAIVSLMLGTVTVGCNPGAGHVASLGETTPHADAEAAGQADKARAALARHDGAKAVRMAERAAAASPRDAAYRMLLGQAYLAAGRFASAEASFRDTLALKPGQPRAGFDLALAEIAQGRAVEARALLDTLSGQVSDADLGLAIALSGDRTRAIALLSDLVRSGKSDARGRQNLALAFALDGRWSEARGTAMQDTAPDRISDQIAGWAELAAANNPRVQVASMLGAASAVADPGRPAMLALATAAPSAPIALAAAPAPAMPAARVAVAPVRAPLPVPAPVTRLISVVAPVAVAAAPIPFIVPAATPVLVAAPAAPRLVRVATDPAGVAPGTIVRSPDRGGWVVQLGAYARAGALEAAWTRASRLSPNIATFAPVRGRTSLSGAAVVRLSVGGFATRERAAGLCRQVRAGGGTCFVRAAGNDTPWRWASREGANRLAMSEARAG